MGGEAIGRRVGEAGRRGEGGRRELESACVEECREGAVGEQDRMGTLYWN